jgi:hypothetical protein
MQVYRDKEGKIVTRAELEAARKAELERKDKERETPEWAAGLRQQREAAERRAATAAEAAKPFARSKCARALWHIAFRKDPKPCHARSHSTHTQSCCRTFLFATQFWE